PWRGPGVAGGVADPPKQERARHAVAPAPAARRPPPPRPGGAGPGAGPARLLWWGPLLLYLYPAVAGLLARSQVPLVAGRYSKALLLFNVGNVLLCGLVGWACWRRCFRGQAAGYLLLILATFLVPGNNELRRLSLIPALL